MATNFEVLGTVGVFGGGISFKFNRSYFLLFGNPTSIRFVGLAATLTKLTINFDRVPQLTSAAAVASNWVVTGGTPITTTGVSVVGNTIEILVSGTFDGNNYNLAVPTGVVSDSGIPADPYVYDGPTTLIFALGALTPPATPPTIANVNPSPGTGVYANTTLQFDVTDVDGFATVIVYATFTDGTKELVYDGAAFSSSYSLSAVAPITDGFHFAVARNAGWPSSPALSVVAVDSLGALV